LQFLEFLSLDQPIFAKQSNTLAILLHIDTAGENAFVAITKHNEVLGMEINNIANTHAQFVQEAIALICTNHSISLQDMDAVVVTMGPGSYTGLRVGLSSAKGIAYALNKPLIGLSTLSLLAHAAANAIKVNNSEETNFQIFAMIDARRMEVFGAIYNEAQDIVLPEQAIILDTAYLEQCIEKGPVYCIGSGAAKTKDLLTHPHLHFIDQHYQIQDCIALAIEKFNAKSFENLAYSSPAYIKDFYMK
jgi:tRNA threonylcarbamoyladenosine biosynthesis protein TsaB